MCIARTTVVAQRQLCKKVLPVKQILIPVRSKCVTFLEEPIYRPRFKKTEWKEEPLWKQLFTRVHQAWQASFFGKRFAVGLALAWYMFQDLENPRVFIDSAIDRFDVYDDEDDDEMELD